MRWESLTFLSWDKNVFFPPMRFLMISLSFAPKSWSPVNGRFERPFLDADYSFSHSNLRITTAQAESNKTKDLESSAASWTNLPAIPTAPPNPNKLAHTVKICETGSDAKIECSGDPVTMYYGDGFSWVGGNMKVDSLLDALKICSS